MIQVAATLGWDVKNKRCRNAHAKPDVLQGSCQVIASKPKKVLDQISLISKTGIVLMTHNYNYDLTMCCGYYFSIILNILVCLAPPKNKTQQI